MKDNTIICPGCNKHLPLLAHQWVDGTASGGLFIAHHDISTPWRTKGKRGRVRMSCLFSGREVS